MFALQCPLLNISYCPPSEATLANGKSMVGIIFYYIIIASFNP